MSNLFERTSLKRLFNVGSSEATLASTYIDMAGWEGCLVMLEGSSAQGSTGSIVLRQSSAATTALAYVMTKTSGMDFTTGVRETIVVDCYRPLKRYLSVRPIFSSGIVGAWGLCYGGRRQGSTEAKADIVKGFTVAMSTKTA